MQPRWDENVFLETHVWKFSPGAAPRARDGAAGGSGFDWLPNPPRRAPAGCPPARRDGGRFWRSPGRCHGMSKRSRPVMIPPRRKFERPLSQASRRRRTCRPAQPSQPRQRPQRLALHAATLFGAIQDCGPDRWRRVLIERAVHLCGPLPTVGEEKLRNPFFAV